jgi:hypothetical protein
LTVASTAVASTWRGLRSTEWGSGMPGSNPVGGTRMPPDLGSNPVSSTIRCFSRRRLPRVARQLELATVAAARRRSAGGAPRSETLRLLRAGARSEHGDAQRRRALQGVGASDKPAARRPPQRCRSSHRPARGRRPGCRPCCLRGGSARTRPARRPPALATRRGPALRSSKPMQLAGCGSEPGPGLHSLRLCKGRAHARPKAGAAEGRVG